MAKFKKGQSGNPEGRKPGTGYAAKLRTAVEADMPEILQSVVGAAKAGDMTAAKMLLDRTLPTLRPTEGIRAMPKFKKGTLSDLGAQVVNSMAKGEVSIVEAQSIMTVLTAHGRLKEMEELEQRILALEEAGEAR